MPGAYVRSQPRRRTETRLPFPCEGEPRPDAEFWFADGNIVLIMDCTAFRVHQSVLSRHSDIFRDLFTIPQPADTETMFGCPVVQIYDPLSDIRLLLRVLYDGGRHCLEHTPELEFAIVDVLVRLGHKYQVEDLRADGLARIKRVFTDNFDMWDSHSRSGKMGTELLRLTRLDAMSAVNLARIANAPSLLPVALYYCCQLDIYELCRGVPRADGTTERLSSEDMDRCIDGMSTLAQKCASGAPLKLAWKYARCTSYGRCVEIKRELLVKLQGAEKRFDALAPMDDDIDWLCATYGLCEECKQVMKTKHLKYRRRVFKELPSYFGLVEWAQLRAAEAASRVTDDSRCNFRTK